LSAIAAGQQYVISTFAGGGPPPTPTSAVKMAIAPQGMAADASGNLFFISLNCVFRLDQNGIVTRVAGNSRTGYSGDGGPALSAMFNTASGLAVDAAGNVYVADLLNRRLRKVSPAGIVTTVAGTGVFGYSGDGGPASGANLNGPSNVAVDNSGNLYIVDGARIRKISTAGIITTVAGNGLYGFSGDGGPATMAELSPYGVAADGKGNIYISDDGNLRVRMVSPAGIITTVAGTGSYGSTGDGGPATAEQLTGASGIAIDNSGNLYFSDSSPSSGGDDCSCVRKVTPAGIITTVSAGDLYEPRALALNAGGDLYIADTGNYGISKVASTGTITTTAGYVGSPSYSGDGGPATGAQLNSPLGLAADAEGNVYIGDTFNNRVRAVSSAGIITTIAGNGVAAYAGDGSPAANSELYFPVGVAADSLGNLYIADHGNGRIRKISKSGIITTVANPGGINVWGLAIDNQDNLYLPDPPNNRINKISPDGTVTTVAGNGTFGFSGDGGPATSAQIRLTFKAALTTDNAGNLYFSDDNIQPPAPGTIPTLAMSTPRIRKVAPDGTITTVAGNGTSGYSGDGGPAIEAQLGSQLNYPPRRSPRMMPATYTLGMQPTSASEWSRRPGSSRL
jgi:sugar lactone lactonase YvrE